MFKLRSLPKNFWVQFLMDLVVVAVLAVLIRAFLLAPFRVSGPSMCDNFNSYDGVCLSGNGEQVLTSRLVRWDLFGIHLNVLDRGDVVVFQAPYDEPGRYFIKRIIGLPGETIKITGGKVYVQKEGTFVELPEPYLNDNNKDHTNPQRLSSQVFKVPEGHYFVMGDNRMLSSDSRRCFVNAGCDAGKSPYLDRSAVQGEVKLVTFPFSHIRLVKPVDYGI